MLKTVALSLLVLVAGAVALAQATRSVAAPAAGKADAVRAISEASAQLAGLNQSEGNIVRLNQQMADLFQALSNEVAKTAVAGGQSPAQAAQGLKQLSQMQVRCAADFLKLQTSMQKEQQSFNTISNVAKSKHDAAMAAIQNTR